MDWTKDEISQIYNTPLIELQFAAVSLPSSNSPAPEKPLLVYWEKLNRSRAVSDVDSYEREFCDARAFTDLACSPHFIGDFTPLLPFKCAP